MPSSVSPATSVRESAVSREKTGRPKRTGVLRERRDRADNGSWHLDSSFCAAAGVRFGGEATCRMLHARPIYALIASKG